MTLDPVKASTGGRGALRAAFVETEERLAALEGETAGAAFKARAMSATTLAAYTRVDDVITADAVGAIGAQDGVTLVADDKYFLKNGAAGSDNALYIVTNPGSGGAAFVLTRDPNWDATARDMSAIDVAEGTVNGGKQFFVSANDPWVVGTDDPAVVKRPTLAELALTTNGNGISLIGIEDSAGTITGTTGETALAELSKRLLGSAANEAAIKALAAAKRSDGALIVDLGTYNVWQFDAESAATASALVLVPDAGTGRWVRKPTVEVASLAFGHADLTDADAQQDLPFASALPAGALVIGTGVNVTAVFDNAGDAASCTFDLGVTGGDTDCFIDGGSLNAVAKVCTPAGVTPVGLFGAITPGVRVDGDVNLDTLTKGAAVAYVAYIVVL